MKLRQSIRGSTAGQRSRARSTDRPEGHTRSCYCFTRTSFSSAPSPAERTGRAPLQSAVPPRLQRTADRPPRAAPIGMCMSRRPVDLRQLPSQRGMQPTQFTGQRDADMLFTLWLEEAQVRSGTLPNCSIPPSDIRQPFDAARCRGGGQECWLAAGPGGRR